MLGESAGKFGVEEAEVLRARGVAEADELEVWRRGASGLVFN